MTAPVHERSQTGGYQFDFDAPPPRRLTTDQNKPDFHPCYVLIDITIDGVERRDVMAYDQDKGTAMLRGGQALPLCVPVPRWRDECSRQVRRSIQKWEENRR